jgi:hypothetical protein
VRDQNKFLKVASPAEVLSTNALAGLHWLTALRDDFDPQRFPGALANPTIADSGLSRLPRIFYAGRFAKVAKK